MPPVSLPAGISVFERGWLSANNILLDHGGVSALIDSGYHTHAEQTLGLVQTALGERPLTHLLNTHLHSDHCGGNARLQAHYPDLETHIPPGNAPHVAEWNAERLSYTTTGQHCPKFQYDHLLAPGSTRLASLLMTMSSKPMKTILRRGQMNSLNACESVTEDLVVFVASVFFMGAKVMARGLSFL